MKVTKMKNIKILNLYLTVVEVCARRVCRYHKLLLYPGIQHGITEATVTIQAYQTLSKKKQLLINHLFHFHIRINLDIYKDNKDYIASVGAEPNIVMETWDRISVAEMLLLVQGLNIHKSSNTDHLNATLLKDCLLCTKDIVTHLFNSILYTSKYPDSWKLGTVVPLFKSGNKLKVNNFRPVCSLPVIGKLMEKLIHRRLFFFFGVKAVLQ